jgi:general secretion pathway protein A
MNLHPIEISSANSAPPELATAIPEPDHDELAELVHPGHDSSFRALAPLRSLLPERNFLEYYGLTDNPFADCVHPGFFYRTESHIAALRSMMAAIELSASLGMVTGPSGTGKTLVSQLLLQQLDPARYPTILVLVTPGLSKTGLLREILSELNIALPVGVTRLQDLIKLLSNQIIDIYERGQRLVLIVDECHLLSADCLHIIRTITNIETPERKLTTCLLFGEARLAQRLKKPGYESLNNRIYMRAVLQPLQLEETSQYIKFRLMVAGRMVNLFTMPAIAALHAHSGGICRTLNKLCTLGLIEGAAQQRNNVDEMIVTSCAGRI